MKRSILLLAGALFAATSLACDGGERLEVSDSPQVLWDRANAAMAALDSYHVAFIFPTPPEDLREEVRWEAEFASPNDYRFLLFSAEGETEEVCESYSLPGGGHGRTCREVLTNITSRSVFETVFVGDKAYARQCQDVGKQCDPWQERPRPELPIAGPSPTYFPQWPLVALEMAQPIKIVGEEEIDNATLIHLHGSVNHLRAIFENERLVLTGAGITSFGEECTAEASFPGEPPGEPTCRELTFEESLEQQEPQLSFYDENPATIDVWLSSDDLLVHHIALTIPPHEFPFDEEGTFTIEYSLFNQVKIEAPR